MPKQAIKECVKCKEKKLLNDFPHSGRIRKDGTRGVHSNCKKCSAERNRLWRKANAEKHRKCTKYWRKANRFHWVILSIRQFAKRGNYSECIATPKELEAAFTGKCHACGLLESECNQKLCVDHDHETGEFRGWLCMHCNINDVLSEEKKDA